MTLKDEYLKKIDDLPVVAFNREQKTLAKKILSLADEKDVAKVYSLLTRRIKTGFVFDEAPEVNHNAVAIVKENPKLNINVANMGKLEDTIEHDLIIGENYDALKNLCATYIDKNGRGIIDVIYIDPPYNTEACKADGNNHKDDIEAKKFIYRDKFTRDGWLNLMNERLKLARKLLSDKGVIFISIDDNEQAYLKVLCDEIFGEENFRSNSIVVSNRGGRDYGGIALQHDYILIYAKSPNAILNLIEEKDKEFQYHDEQGGFDLMELRNRNVKFNSGNRPNLFYPFYVNPNVKDSNGLMEISLEKKTGFVEVLPAISNGIQTVWRWGKEEKARKNLNIEIFGKANKNGGYMIVQKYRKTVKMQRSVWDEKEFVNERGTEVVKEIFNASVFGYPKSVSTIKRVLQLGTSSTSTVLDFFAGSGTTGQAVMELNAEDGGKRKFILVTNNENGIGEKITRERLYRVIMGKGSKGEKIAWRFREDKPALDGNRVRVFGIENHALSIDDLATAEKLKDVAREEFQKLSPSADFSDDFDLYNELAALNPYKKEG